MTDLNLPIGGFFPEESIDDTVQGNYCLETELVLKNGRACLNLILKQSPHIKVLYMPYYQCDDVLSSLVVNEVEVVYYHINAQLEIISAPKLKSHQALLYVNYFGLKSEFAMELYRKYKSQLILDNTQAFFDFSKVDFRFNTARKFFGVSDGGFLHAPSIDFNETLESFADPQNRYLKQLKLGNRLEAFQQYRIAEASMNNRIEGISTYSRNILDQIDMPKVQKIRIENFNRLAKGLHNFNELNIDTLKTFDVVPFAYPFLPKKNLNREELIGKGIFFPKLWPNVLNHGSELNKIEYQLTEKMFPLPIDHRSGKVEMDYIVQTIMSLWKN